MMKYGKILIFGLILILINCQNIENIKQDSKKEVTNNVGNDEYKIINSTFIPLVSPVLLFENEIEFGYDNHRIKDSIPEELITDIYFTKYLVNLKDTSHFYENIQINRNEEILKLEKFGFEELINKFNIDESKSKELNLNKIDNIGLFRLNSANIGEKIAQKIGEKIISYSNIIYNQKKDKACFYFNNQCSGLCGNGELLFVEKINDVWEIKYQITTWIS